MENARENAVQDMVALFGTELCARGVRRDGGAPDGARLVELQRELDRVLRDRLARDVDHRRRGRVGHPHALGRAARRHLF